MTGRLTMRFAKFGSGFALVAGLLLVGGCSHTTEFVDVSTPDNQPLGARLNRAAVIRVAGHAAEKAGYRDAGECPMNPRA